MLESNRVEDHSNGVASRKYFYVLTKLYFMFGKKNTEHCVRERGKKGIKDHNFFFFSLVYLSISIYNTASVTVRIQPISFYIPVGHTSWLLSAIERQFSIMVYVVEIKAYYITLWT